MIVHFTEKLQSVALFLNGLRDPRIADQLATFGFTADDAREGRSLLDAVFASPTAPRVGDHRAASERVTDWARQWLPLARLVLEHRCPRVAEWCFDEPSVAATSELPAAAQRFVWRFRMLDDGSAGFGEEGEAAVVVLCKRGITAANLTDLQQDLDRLEQDADAEADAEAEAELLLAYAAEERLWRWYEEWRGVTLHVIKDARVLHALGLLLRSDVRRLVSMPPPPPEEDDGPPTTPQADLQDFSP
jgi:hypothetical protein